MPDEDLFATIREADEPESGKNDDVLQSAQDFLNFARKKKEQSHGQALTGFQQMGGVCAGLMEVIHNDMINRYMKPIEKLMQKYQKLSAITQDPSQNQDNKDNANIELDKIKEKLQTKVVKSKQSLQAELNNPSLLTLPANIGMPLLRPAASPVMSLGKTVYQTAKKGLNYINDKIKGSPESEDTPRGPRH